MKAMGGQTNCVAPDPSCDTQFSDTDSDISSNGIFGEIAKRCCRKFKVTVRKDFRITEKMTATVGGEYCLQSGKAEPIARVDYTLNDRFSLQVGNRKSKLKMNVPVECWGSRLRFIPALHVNYDDQFSMGVSIKLGNMRTLAAALGILSGNCVDRRTTFQVLPQTDETSGIDVSTKLRVRRRKQLVDGVVREINTIIHLGPPQGSISPAVNEMRTPSGKGNGRVYLDDDDNDIEAEDTSLSEGQGCT